MKQLLLAVVALCSFSCINAQTGSSQIFRAPLAGTAVLRDVEDKYNAQVISFEAPEPDGEAGQEEFRKLKAEVADRYPHRRAQKLSGATAKTAAAPPQPIIQRAFVPDSFTSIPPDNYMAANNGVDAINVMNSYAAVLNHTTGAIVLRRNLFSFTRSVGLGTISAGNYYRYDPKVMYDPEEDRFVFVTLAGTNQDSYIIVGFSSTNDPAAGWYFYKYYGDYASDSTWFDYPAISITHNELFLTGNKLVYDGSFQTGFRQSIIYEIRKSDGYNGLPLTTRTWDGINYNGATIRNIFPVKGGGSIKGPEQYFLSVRNMDPSNDSVFLLKIADTMNSANNTLSITGAKSNLMYGFPPNGRQPGIKDVLQTNDARVLGAFVEGNEIQFVSNSVEPSTGADAIYHGVMTNYTTTPSVTANFITVDTMDFAYPNISYTGINAGATTSIISFDYSGPKHYPGVGAVFWDGAAYSPLLQVKKGDSSIKQLTDSVQRWGDYTGSQPKWNTPGHVWTVGLYGKSDKSYGVWMSLLRSPYSVGIETPSSGTDGAVTAYPNPAMSSVRLRFSLKEEANLHFDICSMSGSIIDKVLDAHCERGQNEFQFNTSTLSAGHYLLRGIDRSGKVLVSERFVKQ